MRTLSTAPFRLRNSVLVYAGDVPPTMISDSPDPSCMSFSRSWVRKISPPLTPLPSTKRKACVMIRAGSALVRENWRAMRRVSAV